ncbi:MAG: hypothetical protein IPK65_03695 [Gammaproteobacteria bacterium]|nr:hypothetical protein [Gammaproteobacteria bacterium]
MSHDPQVNEEISHRATMLVLSITLVLATLSMEGPLGWRSVFPLIAIWPGIAALVGLQLAPWGKIFGKSSDSQAAYKDIPTHA